MCYATLDTDAVGSARLPASCCGVIGFKPSYGRIDLKGILDGEQEPDEFIVAMGHGAITTRDIEDTAIVFDALTNSAVVSQLGDSSAKLRIGVGVDTHPNLEVKKTIDDAIKKFHKGGNEVVGAEIPSGDPAAGLTNIKEDRETVEQRYFTKVDVILLPTTMKTVPTVKDAMDNPEEAVSAEYTAFANYFGLPALSIPCGFDNNGMPIGLQIVGKPGGEVVVLNAALQFQHVHDLKHPTIQKNS
jgi:aspartyl-tRNA(Asn)/glutamyl-tRNA(Gln) amidotransferase subunit A